MKFDLTVVKFSRNDLKRGIFLPKGLTAELAEDIGFHLGDGYLGDYSSKSNPHKYELTCAGHLIDDKYYYVSVLAKRRLSLFGIEPKISTARNNSIRAKILSKAIVTFYRDVLGIKCGKKIDVKIPEIIFSAPKYIQAAFVRGLFDADGCLTFLRKHKKVNYYPSIRLGIISKHVFAGVTKILANLGFSYTKFVRHPNQKFRIKHMQLCLDINGTANLERWVNIIGSNSLKTALKYSIWKVDGNCPKEQEFRKYLVGPRRVELRLPPCKGTAAVP